MTQQTLSKVLKAVYSGAVAFLGMLSVILVGNTSFGDMTAGQWVTVSLFALTAAGGTFGLAGWSGPPSNGGSAKG